MQKLALVVNNSTNNMTILTRNTDNGRLTPLATIATGSYPLDVAVTPNGQFAYVTNTVSGSVTSYRINGTTVTSIPQSTQYTFNPYGLTVDPNGQFLRVANYSTNMLSSYSIDNATGLLTARGSVPTGIVSLRGGDASQRKLRIHHRRNWFVELGSLHFRLFGEPVERRIDVAGTAVLGAGPEPP